MAIYTVFDKRNRNAGTYISPEVTVPPGISFFEANGLLDTSAILDPTLVMTWEIQVTYDNVNWILLIGGGWQGGLDQEGNSVGAPNQTWQSSGTMPLKARGQMTISKRISIGFELTIS